MGINKFFDMTHEEFAKVYMPNGLAKDASKSKKKIQLESIFKQEDTTPAPENVDWKASGKVSIPGDQASCGSCWAWTTATTIESLIAINKNTKPEPLSV